LSTEDEECSGGPTQVTIPVNVDVIHSIILDDQRISVKKIAETLAISQESVGYIIHEILDMRKLSAKWVPKCLSAVRKRDQVLASQAILDPIRRDPVGFFNHFITMDEIWIQKPKNNPRNGDSGFPCPKTFKTQKSSSKEMASVFWDKNGILLVDHLKKSATITAKYYVALLDKLKQQLVSKR
jgi:hypothetical protein